MFPSFLYDSLLVFSSNRDNSKKDLDLYFSKVNAKGVWSEPELLEGLNSTSDDFSVLFTDENSGYLSTAKDGNDHIYYFEKN